MDPLTIALAIYGGYQGYKSAKKSGAGTAGRILGTALGAYGGYSAGSGITGSALGQQYLPSFLTQPVTPGVSEMLSSGIGTLSNLVPSFGTDVATTAVTDGLTTAAIDGGMQAGLGAYNPELASFGADAVAGRFQPLQTLSTATPTNYFSPMESQYAGPGQFSAPATPGPIPPPPPPATETSFLEKTKKAGGDAYSYLFEKTDPKTGKQVLDVGKAALIGLPALAYASGAFETEPYERSMFTYNVNYPDLYRSRKFYVQDPKTGEVKESQQQQYIPEERADVQEGSKFGPYRRETITLQQGGLATLNHFKDGGVNYLPSKTIYDEDDEDNYMRTNGYVEDGAGNGDKEEDTMLAQLADGEFVTRTDGVLGAGILAGANPKNAKEMRKLGAEFFYEQQKRFKRIYDLLDASRKATAH
jgi:hypothetical protein